MAEERQRSLPLSDPAVTDTVHLFDREEKECLSIVWGKDGDDSSRLTQSPWEDNSTICDHNATDVDGSRNKTQSPQRPLQIMQYTSSDDLWGLHSCVWDGGLALLAYMAQRQELNSEYYDWDNMSVLDLGSGTGVVGLGSSILSKGRAIVALTDLPEALPLLQQNVNMNAHHWVYQKHPFGPMVRDLIWGEPIDTAWLSQHFLRHGPSSPNSRSTMSNGSLDRPRRRVLITGADIVYRKPLFLPLLSTVAELEARLLQLDCNVIVETLLACQTVRTHLHGFWDMARRLNFSVELQALCYMPPQIHQDSNTIDLSAVKVEFCTQRKEPELVPPCRNVVLIARIFKLPYAFNI